MAITRKARAKAKAGAKAKAKGSVLKVDSADKIAAMESLLGKGSITFVLIYADWCGACTRFKKNIWNPMCQKSATHSRIALRDDMVKNTSLSSANFDYLPSLVVVDENGKIQSFKTPEGKDTNAMPTPQSLQEMNTIVNVPVGNVGNVGPSGNVGPTPNITPSQENQFQMSPLEEDPEIPLSPPLTHELMNEPLTITPRSKPTASTLGKSYIPTPMVAPSGGMKGGMRSMRRMRGRMTMSLPKKVLKGLASLFKRSRKHRR